jgi:hypothetical protein
MESNRYAVCLFITFVYNQALEDGQVYNAVDACKKMGIDGETMDTTWGAAKKAGELIKFGGGFYCGKLAL